MDNNYIFRLGLFFLGIMININEVDAQFIYKKEFKDGIFSIRFDKYSGPMALTIKPSNSDQVDTVYYSGERRLFLHGYFISDSYLSGDTLLVATGTEDGFLSLGGRIGLNLRENGQWKFLWLKDNVLLIGDDLKKKHKVEFIDSKRIKTTVDDVEKLYEIDYKELKVKLITKQE